MSAFRSSIHSDITRRVTHEGNGSDSALRPSVARSELANSIWRSVGRGVVVAAAMRLSLGVAAGLITLGAAMGPVARSKQARTSAAVGWVPRQTPHLMACAVVVGVFMCAHSLGGALQVPVYVVLSLTCA